MRPAGGQRNEWENQTMFWQDGLMKTEQGRGVDGRGEVELCAMGAVSDKIATAGGRNGW